MIRTRVAQKGSEKWKCFARRGFLVWRRQARLLEWQDSKILAYVEHVEEMAADQQSITFPARIQFY